MRITHIKDKLHQFGVDWRTINLGEFDEIAEPCAKKRREPTNEWYPRCGAFFRPNCERGILIYHLIRKFRMTSFVEVGFGRGYVSLCAAKAFHDMGAKGRIVSIDLNFDQNFLKALQQIMPVDWFKMLELFQGPSSHVLQQVQGEFDLSYIDGDHSREGTLSDWTMLKDRTNVAILFDDYHLPSKQDAGIQCRDAIDNINFEGEGWQQPELIRMDRRLFPDDRQLPDEAIDYGQVLTLKKGITLEGDDW